MGPDSNLAGGAAREEAAAAVLSALLARRSVSPRRLRPPGPDAPTLALALRAALRGPDHGRLVPWRVIDFQADSRDSLADAFVAEKRRRVPDATAPDLARARAQALEPPLLLGFVVRIDATAAVPAHEQWLAAGAALGQLLGAFHLLGFGAIVLSGERCADPDLARALGVREDERLVGFVNVGSIAEPPAAAREVEPGRVWSRWEPPPGG